MAKRKAIPFTPELRGRKETDNQQAAKQLNELIREQQDTGWIFCHVETLKADRSMGCLFAFTPQPTIYCQVAIFEQS